MLLNTFFVPKGQSSCVISYEEDERWLQAVWNGYVDQSAAKRGAELFLRHAACRPSAFMLSDNSRLRGPWFQDLEWLATIWMPQAATLGLRYVAHVEQADSLFSRTELTLNLGVPFELQLFHDLEDARNWLREVRRNHPTHA